MPAAPPSADSTIDSVSSWRMTRPRPAPRTTRMAISFCRASDRASIRFATLAHAMSRTAPTAISSTTSAGRISPNTSRGAGNERETELGVVRVRVALEKPVGNRVDLGLGLAERRARTQACERVQSVIPSLLRIVRAQRQRDPQLRERAARVVERQAQLGRQHADDGVGRGVELNRASDDGRIRPELRSPETLGQHDDVFVAGAILVRREQAPRDRRGAERGEDAGLHLRGEHAERIAAPGEIE